MSITTTIRSDHWIEDSDQVLYEFFTDDDCFGDVDAGIMQVVPYVTTTNESFEINRCEYGLINAPNESTGAGGKETNAVFQDVYYEIIIKGSETTKKPGRQVELELKRDVDKLITFFRSIKGRPALGNAGIRNAQLFGPTNANSKNYYGKSLILKGRIEVG